MTTELTQSAANEWEARADRAAMDLEGHRQLTRAKEELRDRLVLEGVDTGHSLTEVARVMHLSYTRVQQIVAKYG